jgi:hypothetical protein
MNRAATSVHGAIHTLSATSHKSRLGAVLTKPLGQTIIRTTHLETSKYEFRVDSGNSRVPAVFGVAARYYDCVASPCKRTPGTVNNFVSVGE